ncbi:MAG: outer membrane protein assembly factor BamD [Vicingaceae bacterium]
MQKIFFAFFVLSMGFWSCSDYNKVLKSPNPELKYQKSIEYYEDGEYVKAMSLFEELIPLFRGTDKGQTIYYYYCYANFYTEYYIQAAYHFKRYAKTYPLSQYAEDALFMSAYCNYLESPVPTLDQEPTYNAIGELQLFVNTYPKSPLVDSANTLVDELQFKLETKDFMNSKQYYKIKRYKAAVVALENTLQDYPQSQYEEEIKLLILKSYYELSINSIKEKKLERFNKGIQAYYDFIDNFAEGKNVNEAETIYAKLVRERQKFLEENPEQNEL